MGAETVVLDTNIIVSGIGWNGKPRIILNLAIEKKINWVITKELLNELAKTIEYPKFKFSELQKAGIMQTILEIAIFVMPMEKITILPGAGDNRLLECALIGKADFIITGDKEVLSLHEFKGIKIVTASDFLKLEFNND